MEAMDSVQIDANLGSDHINSNQQNSINIPPIAIVKLSSNNALPAKEDASPAHMKEHSTKKISKKSQSQSGAKSITHPSVRSKSRGSRLDPGKFGATSPDKALLKRLHR